MSDKRKDLIEGFKEVAKNFVNKHFPKEQKFAEALLDDGETMISYDAEVLATGVIVSVVDSQGNLQPAPMGTHTLQDGTTFEIVDEEGRADNVVLATAPEEGEQPAATGAEMDNEETQKAKRIIESTVKESHFTEEDMKEINELKESFAALKEELEALKAEKAEFSKNEEATKAELEEAKKAFDEDYSEFKKEAKEAFELIGKIAEEDAATPTEKEKKDAPKKGDYKRFL